MIVICFFKQKPAYDMLRSLVGSEMCIRDRIPTGEEANEETLVSAKNELMKSEAPVCQGVFVNMNHGEKKLVRALSEDPALQLYTIDYLANHGLSLSLIHI